MISAPLVVVWLTSQVLYLRFPMVAGLVLSVVLSYLCAAVASRLWERRSKTAEISFSELMIWSWYRLQKAEREIERGVRATENPGSREEHVQMLHELNAALESKDPYTRGHSKRVERHAFKTGVALGLPLEDVDVLRMSAALHDLGKIRIPNSVLHKPGALTDEERLLVQEHPDLGAEIVAGIGVESVVDAVRHHHERWDGKGYPQGKSGEDIPLFSRVIAVADAYDAIRSNRSYRRGVSRDKAVQVLEDASGTQFDAGVVHAFLTTLPARGRSVAAFTSLATGPGALWRYLAQFFQRFGGTALAPAIGAAGTAVIVGTTSMLSPPTPAVPSPTSAVRAISIPRDARPSDGGDSGAIDARPLGTSQGRRERRMAAAEERSDRLRAELRKERRSTQRDEDVTRSRRAGTSGPTLDPDPGSDSGATATRDTSTSGDSTSEPAENTDSGGQATEGDPNAKGKDCDKKSDSKGAGLHCG